MLEKLREFLKAKQDERTAKMKKVDKATEVEELRGLQTEIEEIDKEIRSLEDMIKEAEEDEGITERTAIVNGTPEIVGSNAQSQEIRKTEDEKDMEYRRAFQRYIATGEVTAELRKDANTTTIDVTHAIPTVLVNRILEKLETIGNILPLVTRTNYPAGMNIPTSNMRPVASWVGEGESSDRQKKEVITAISFTHFKLRCEISMSKEVEVMTISAFEEKFVNQVSDAMIKAVENAIINGAYDNVKSAYVGPRGILEENGGSVLISNSGSFAFTTLTEAEGKLPLAYENGTVWFMTKKTFYTIAGMTDEGGQPIARTNYGISGRPERTLLGRPVVLNEYMDSYTATVANDTVVAFLFNPKDYVLNTNYNMGIMRKQDWDTEDMLTKAVMAVDGAVIDKNSLVKIVKKNQ